MSALPRVLVLNGPNLNFLGRREPQIYGRTTLTDVVDELRRRYDGVLDIDHLQSNHEGVLIDRLQAAADEVNLLGVVLNAGAFTHTSVALRDAVSSIAPLPVVECTCRMCRRAKPSDTNRSSLRFAAASWPVSAPTATGLPWRR